MIEEVEIEEETILLRETEVRQIITDCLKLSSLDGLPRNHLPED